MYDELFELVAKDVEAGGVFATILSGHEDDPSRHALPLRLLGGLHRLVLDGRAAQLRRWYPSTGGTWDAGTAWPEIVLTAAKHSDSLRAALDQPPQTNEVGRSAALIGGLLRINRGSEVPVRLFEIGSSAGLNLRADHYRYRYADSQWGPVDSPVTIDDAWHGALPPEGAVRIVERQGCAIAVARKVPAGLDRQRGADAVAGLTLADGALTVLWHSITWQYLSADERKEIRDGVGALGAQADARSPFAHLTLEPARGGPGAPLRFLVRARSWPGGELQILGECHAHGPPVNWN